MRAMFNKTKKQKAELSENEEERIRARRAKKEALPQSCASGRVERNEVQASLRCAALLCRADEGLSSQRAPQRQHDSNLRAKIRAQVQPGRTGPSRWAANEVLWGHSMLPQARWGGPFVARGGKLWNRHLLGVASLEKTLRRQYSIECN